MKGPTRPYVHSHGTLCVALRTATHLTHRGGYAPSISDQPNLEHFRKHAKQLLRDVRAGDGDATRRARLSHPRWSAGVGDICDAEVVDTIVAEADVLFHLAANFGRSSGSDPGACLHTNVHGTEVVPESASRHGVRFLVMLPWTKRSTSDHATNSVCASWRSM